MNERDARRKIIRQPLLFLAAALGLTWLFWIPAAVSRLSDPAAFVLVLHYAGGIAPLAVTLLFLFLLHRREERGDYWKRLAGFERIGPGWYAATLLFTPALTGLSIAVDLFAGGAGGMPEAAARFAGRPLAVVPFLLFTLVFGPLPEEAAWRGYALDRLQKNYSALTSSLVVGVAWTVWHLPPFFIEGSYQHGLGVGTIVFWLFLANLPAQSVIMTWIFNNTGKSTLSAVLFHFMVNLTGELFALSPRAEIFYTVLLYIAAATVTTIYGPLTLTGMANREL